MAHRKTGESRKSDRPEPASWDGLTKSINPFNLGIDPGLNINQKVEGLPGKAVRIPPDTRQKRR